MSSFNDSASLLPCLYKCFALLTSCILLLAPISSSASKTNPLSSSDSDRIPQRRPELLECCGHIFRSCLQLIGMLEGWCQHKCLLTKWWQPCTQSHGKLSLSDFLHSCHQQVKPTLPEPHLSLSFLRVFCASIDRSLVCVHAAAWTPPPSLPLSGHKVSDHPSFLFPLWKGFIWWHHLLTKKREGGLLLTERWMSRVTRFCFSEMRSHAGEGRRPKGTTCSLVPSGWANHGSVGHLRETGLYF